MSDETEKSRRRQRDTRYRRRLYATEGQEPPVFKDLLQRCGGGISQSAADAFNGLLRAPAGAKQPRDCKASPRFTWGPVVHQQAGTTRRFRAWGYGQGTP